MLNVLPFWISSFEPHSGKYWWEKYLHTFLKYPVLHSLVTIMLLLVWLIYISTKHSSHSSWYFFQMGLWARPDAIGGVDYALQKGVEQLDFYDEYFGTKFPLPKMGNYLVWLSIGYGFKSFFKFKISLNIFSNGNYYLDDVLAMPETQKPTLYLVGFESNRILNLIPSW